MLTTLALVFVFLLGVVGLVMMGQRYQEDEPIHHRAMTSDAPVAPMSESTMPNSDDKRVKHNYRV